MIGFWFAVGGWLVALFTVAWHNAETIERYLLGDVETYPAPRPCSHVRVLDPRDVR